MALKELKEPKVKAKNRSPKKLKPKEPSGRIPPGRKQRTKLFKHGGGQAVYLPKNCRLDGIEVYIKKEGDRLVITPINENEWQDFLEALEAFPDDFNFKRDQPKMQIRNFGEMKDI